MASSPAPSGASPSMPPSYGVQIQGPGGEPAPARLMQIKVLYTFDNEKSTCLARCSQPVNVHTLQLEDGTEIGVVELRTCIRAILSASPELIAPKTNSDYTIYAYDYSEYETPLVGQGMLSWALASTSATPSAPAEQSLTPVTGRVTRNVRSLFPNAGPPEILQVKLKLVPVPKAMETEYAEGMEKYRDPSNYSSQGFDPAAWNAFLQTRQTFPSPAPSPAPPHSAPGFQPTHPQNPNPTTLYAPSPSTSYTQQPPQFVFQANGAASASAAPKSGSRPGTPRARRASVQSRPSSRASNRGGAKPQRAAPLQRVDSAPAAVPTLDANDYDNGQARKRARVQQADWRGPSVFDNNHEPLRVAASAAASMRGHRPQIPNHPTAADIAAAEPGPRPPTPRPAGPRLLRNDSSMSINPGQPQRRWYQSPYAMSTDGVEAPDSEAGTPIEDGFSAVSTPADIPSSPPVVHRASIEPSSPPLPRLTSFNADSGFVSGNMDEGLNDEGSKLDAPPVMSEMPSSEETSMPDVAAPKRPQRPALAPKPSYRSNRAGSFAASSPRLPPLIPSRMDATSPAPMLLPQTESAEPDISAVAGQQGVAKLSSGAKRYRSIQTRMEEDIAAGKLPPFCKNCGEIDTPTWRKCFIKIVSGVPDAAAIAAEHGDTLIAWEVTEKSDSGDTLAYRIIKKSIAKEEAEFFEQLKLCNSCGMWLFKTKTMRPPDKWQKPPPKLDKNGNPAKKRPARAKSGSVPAEVKVDAVNMDADDAMLWSALTAEGVQAESNEWALTDVSGRSDKSLPKSNGKRARVSSASDAALDRNGDPFLADKGAMAAYQRAVHSSPPKFPGSKGSPIDLSNDTPEQGIRRLLFPSPRKEGEFKTLNDGQHTGTPTKSKGASVVQMADPFGDMSIDKENKNDDDRFTTPKSKKSRVDVLKTPTRSSPRIAAKNQAKHAAENQSPRQTRTGPATPSRAAAQHVPDAEMTPFTSQLNAMMSDGINGFGPFAAQDPSGLFAFSDFSNMDDFGLGDGTGAGMGLPQSDADFFPVFDDKDFAAEVWNGGPLLEGELEELLKEAGDDAFFDAAGPSTQPTPAATAAGDTPAYTGEATQQVQPVLQEEHASDSMQL